MTLFKKRNLLGIDIYDTTREDFIKVLSEKISNNEKNIVFGISAAAYGRLRYRRDLYKIYKQMDILIAEGAGLPLFAKLFGVKISEKIGLVNVTYNLLNLANKNRLKVLFFGSTQEINDQIFQKVQSDYPNIKLCPGINGYFNENDIPGIIKQINVEKPDILFIGISYPIKERFAAKYKNQINTKLIVPVGGAFDVLVGKVKKSKEISKVIPTAWLYRFIQEPKRLFKPIIVTVSYSLFIMLPQLLFIHYFIKKNPSIKEFHKLNDKEWDPEFDNVK